MRNNNSNNNHQRTPKEQLTSLSANFTSGGINVNASTGGSISSSTYRTQARPPGHPRNRSQLIITDDLSSIPTSPTSTDRQTSANSIANTRQGLYPRTILNPNNHQPVVYSPSNSNTPKHSNISVQGDIAIAGQGFVSPLVLPKL